MKGLVLGYTVQSNSGVISGDDGQHYTFVGMDWKEAEPPRRGMQVDFVGVGGMATDIYVAVGSGYGGGMGMTAGVKSKMAAGLLGIFLGSLGIHKFYLGYTGPGVILLLCGTVGWITLGILPFIAWAVGLIEGIIYLTKTDEQFEYEYVTNQKSWF